MTACLTNRSDNYSLDECHIVESRDEIPRVNLAHPNFFTFYKAVGLKGCLLSLLSLKCASNEHQDSVRDPKDYHFPPSNLGCRGTTSWLPGVGTLFSFSHL